MLFVSFLTAPILALHWPFEFALTSLFVTVTTFVHLPSSPLSSLLPFLGSVLLMPPRIPSPWASFPQSSCRSLIIAQPCLSPSFRLYCWPLAPSAGPSLSTHPSTPLPLPWWPSPWNWSPWCYAPSTPSCPLCLQLYRHRCRSPQFISPRKAILRDEPQSATVSQQPSRLFQF